MIVQKSVILNMVFLNDSGTNKEIITNLTKRVYCLTLLFPKKEPLRYKMREIADDILSEYIFIDCFIENDYLGNKVEDRLKTVETKIDELYALFSVINAFFDIAISQNWVKEGELLEAKREYAKVAEVIKKEWDRQENSLKDNNVFIKEKKQQGEEIEKSSSPLSTVNNILLSEKTESERAVGQNLAGKKRQEVIISFLKEHGRAQVWQIKELFPKITKRTIRRDFDTLVKQGLVKRMGQRSETFYQLSSQ